MMHLRLLPTPLLAAFLCALGCTGNGESEVAPRLAPADGQTDVGAFQPIELDGYGVRFPTDHPLPDFVSVVEQQTLMPVAGELTSTEEGVAFVPDERWAADTDFLITVSEPLEDSREPGFRLPVDEEGEPYLGVTGFSTRNDPRPLLLLISGDRFCMVASQPLLPADLQRLTVDRGGVRIAPSSLDVLDPQDFEDEVPSGEDRGLGVVCGPGDGVERVWLGERSVRASNEQLLDEAVRDLRRFR